jgi:hypothetical protein
MLEARRWLATGYTTTQQRGQAEVRLTGRGGRQAGR